MRELSQLIYYIIQSFLLNISTSTKMYFKIHLKPRCDHMRAQARMRARVRLSCLQTSWIRDARERTKGPRAWSDDSCVDRILAVLSSCRSGRFGPICDRGRPILCGSTPTDRATTRPKWPLSKRNIKPG